MFTVELMRDGRAVKRADVSAGSDVEAAKAWGPVKAGLGREPPRGDFIRVTHQASGRTSWFLPGG
jgi:hypothetical protein